MEFSQIFGFFNILSRSNKIVLKNAKSIAVITALSLLLSSILLLIFSCIYPSARNYLTNSILNSDSSNIFLQTFIFFIAIFAIDLPFLFAYIAIIHASGIATILASVASHSDTTLSLRDLYSSFKAKWKSPFRFNAGRSGKSTSFLFIFSVAISVPLVIFYPNPFMIGVLVVLGVSLCVYQMYESVVLALASVIPVVEEGCEAVEAKATAERLVEGRRLDGFMVNLFFNLIGLIVCFGFWMIVEDKGRLNLMVYGLFFVDVLAVLRIVVCVAYTVYYFECMEYHGEKLQIGNFHYTAVANHIEV